MKLTCKDLLEAAFAFFLVSAVIAVFVWSGLEANDPQMDLGQEELGRCFCLDDCFYTAIAVATEAGEGAAMRYEEMMAAYDRCEEECYGNDEAIPN